MSRIVEVPECTLLVERKASGQFAIDTEDGLTMHYWIPWMHLKEGSVRTVGQTGSIFIPLWLAEDEDIEYAC